MELDPEDIRSLIQLTGLVEDYGPEFLEPKDLALIARLKEAYAVETPSVKNPEAPGELSVGDYVFVSRWADCDPADPWAVGHVSETGKDFVCVESDKRRWPRAMRITPAQGARIISEFTRLACEPRDLGAVALVFGQQRATVGRRQPLWNRDKLSDVLLELVALQKETSNGISWGSNLEAEKALRIRWSAAWKKARAAIEQLRPADVLREALPEPQHQIWVDDGFMSGMYKSGAYTVEQVRAILADRSREWFPIESAPKDGTSVLLCKAVDADGKPIDWTENMKTAQVFVQVAAWWGDEWIVYCSSVNEPHLYFDPTHWMQIPLPPSTY